MARPRRVGRPRLLTEVELELMTQLWHQGEATVRDVIADIRLRIGDKALADGQ